MSITSITISRNKIVIPVLRREVLRRARLLALFDDILEKKLVLMVAPAGYGKTSLLVNFAHVSEMPVCWLSLDSLDKDPQRFITYLIAALTERFHTFGRRSNSVLRSITSFEQDSERLLTSLINETNDLIKEHFVLVVDDYHLVDSIASIRDIFSRFISIVGENCHVILASRRLPTLPDITLMVARQQVSGFDLEELSFRPEEISALFKQNYGVILAKDAAEELVRQTEGWITGLHLTATEATRAIVEPLTGGSMANQMRSSRATGVDLANYLDQQVLSQQSPELREFMLKTSLLEEFDSSLCEAVLGAGDWRNLFQTVQRNNLFVLPVGPQGEWLRYHHLFGEFLQERILQESPEIASAILKRLAEVYEEHGEWEKAYALIRQYGHPEALAGLVERIGIHVLLGEHYITFQSWLDEFPDAVLENRPALLSLKGVLMCSLGNGRAALPMLDRAIGMLQTSTNPPVLAITLVRRAAARRLVGDYSGAILDADEALLLSETIPDNETIKAEAQRFKGISLFRLGKVEQAFASLEDSMRCYESLGEAESIARLQMDLGWIYQSTGKLAAAARFYEKALTLWKREDNLYSKASVLNNLAVLYSIQGDYESAVKTLEEGLTCARQGGFRWQEALLLTSLGDILSDLDEYESACQTYITASSLARQVSYQFLVNYIFLVQARLMRLHGEFNEAHRQLEEARPLIQSSGSNYELGLFHLESGCLSLAEAQLKPAGPELVEALKQFQLGNLSVETDWTRVWLAATLAASGEDEAARGHLQPVLETLSQEAGDTPLVYMVRHAAPWLMQLYSEKNNNPLSRRIAKVEERLPPLRKRLRRMLKAAPMQSSRLTIQALGKPQVRINGNLVTQSQWQTLSVRDLFFFFLFSSHPASKDEIGATLWPEIDRDQLKLRFKNNLYRLRHAIGQDAILFENNQYFFNRYLDFEYDIEEFDAHLAQARTVEKVEDQIVHLQAATKLWHGPYLQGVDAIWAEPERQRLERSCLEALRKLANLHQQAGDWDAALQACQHALEVNTCLEDFHRLAMRLHASKGDQLAVIWQYQACRDALHDELDMKPSEETLALYRHLTA